LFLLPAYSFGLDTFPEGFFLDLEGQYYIVPDFAGTLDTALAERYGVSNGLVKPYPGFRLGAGYEWQNFRLSLESGYTYIAGTNPLVLDIHLIPLTLRGGYAFRLGKFSILPSLGAGLVFASVSHYETAIAMLLDDLSHSSNRSFLVNAALRLIWSFTPALGLYAGAGIDCVVEQGGMLPLPAAALGISFRPFLMGRRPPARTETPPRVVEQAQTVPEAVPPKPAQAEIPEPEPPPETPAPARVLRVLYFPADAALPVSSHLAELDAAAELLISSAALVRLRGYTAPYNTPEAQRALSEERARFCGEYLIKEHGIAPERIITEWYGAERLPESSDGSDWTRRCVEIIIERR
jgi:outer membrane protein OmpA-like peptidoglycan-associated protein